MKKFIALFLAFTALAALFAACSDKPEVPADIGTSSAAPGSSEAPAKTETALPPLDVKKYGGEEFTVLWPEPHPDGHFMHNEIAVAEENGDVIDSAVYKRNVAVETAYDIKIVQQLMWCSNISGKVESDIKAGDNNYDAFCAPIAMVVNYGASGVCADYKGMPYYSEDMPWWNHGVMDEFALRGHRFFGSGDIIFSDNFYPMTVMVNSDVYTTHKLPDDLFGTVKDRKWTFEKLIELSKDLPSSSDDVWDGNDNYGVLVYNSALRALFSGFGGHFSSLNDAGDPEWVMTADNSQDKVEAIINFFNNGHIAYDSSNDNAADDNKKFIGGQVLFFVAELITAERLVPLGMEDYWLLPMSLYNTDQPDYICVMNDAVVVSVPANADLERSSLILSALGRESVDTLTPAFFDIVLSNRYINDFGSLEMLGIILDTVSAPDLAVVFNWGSCKNLIGDMARKNTVDLEGTLKPIKNTVNALIKNFSKSMDGLD